MKIALRILCIFACFFLLEKLIRTQTAGFRLEKTTADFPSQKAWEIECNEPYEKTLSQPFFFLGSGVQCYAFLSEDGKTVLKIFKHYHMWPSSKLLKKIPFPKFLHPWKENILSKRKKRIESIFSSALIAYKELKEQTQVFHIHLNADKNRYPLLTIYDKIGIRYTLDLNKTPFILQKKAELIFPYFKTHFASAQELINALITCINTRSKKGIANSDPIIRSNFGVCDGKVIEIDIGSFTKKPYMKNPRIAKKELFYEMLELRQWFLKQTPEQSAIFEQKLLEILNE